MLLAANLLFDRSPRLGFEHVGFFLSSDHEAERICVGEASTISLDAGGSTVSMV